MRMVCGTCQLAQNHITPLLCKHEMASTAEDPFAPDYAASRNQTQQGQRPEGLTPPPVSPPPASNILPTRTTSIAGIAACILLGLAFLFAVIALGTKGWAYGDPLGFTGFVGVDVVVGCQTLVGGIYACQTFRLDDFAGASSPITRFYRAGQACIGLFVTAMILWVISLIAILFVMVAPMTYVIAASLAFKRFVKIKFIILGVMALATFFSALAWIVWIGVAKPDNGFTACEYF